MRKITKKFRQLTAILLAAGMIITSLPDNGKIVYAAKVAELIESSDTEENLLVEAESQLVETEVSVEESTESVTTEQEKITEQASDVEPVETVSSIEQPVESDAEETESTILEASEEKKETQTLEESSMWETGIQEESVEEESGEETEPPVNLNDDGNLASGVIDEDYGYMTWVIDANGKLTVNGWGDYAEPDPYNGTRPDLVYREPPWRRYGDDYGYIKTAEINVTGMKDASHMFVLFKNLTSVDLSGFDTSNITNMYAMFDGCFSLTSLDLSGFDTSHVTDMSCMFESCRSLTSLDLSGFDTSHVTDMSYMFKDCRSLKKLDLSSFSAEEVTDMCSMFKDCSSLTSLDLSNFTAEKVTDMRTVFEGCNSLTNVDLSNFNPGKVTTVQRMFSGCSSLTELNLSGFITNNIQDMSYMFHECSSLTELDMSQFSTVYVTDMESVFEGCSSLKELDLHNFDTDNVTNMVSMFNGCSGLTKIDVSSFYTKNVKSMAYMFGGCMNLTSLDLSNFDTVNVNSMTGMFWGCCGLTSLNVGSFHTENVVSMNSMFCDCSSLTSLDVSSFDTHNVTSMGSYINDYCGMFAECSSLTSLDLGNFDTTNVRDMGSMFAGCSALENLNISNFNTGNVRNMLYMFADCNSLTDLDLSNFDTNNTSSMNSMFSGCRSLTTLELGSFDTNSVTDMYGMFNGCSNIETLDLSSFDISNITSKLKMQRFIDGCRSLKTIYTPYNVKVAVDLLGAFGVSSEDNWYRSDGTTVTEFPQNLSYSVALGKNYIPEELQLSGISNDIFWEIDRYGTLTLIGSGDWVRNSDGLGPWCKYPERIKKAVIRLTDTINADSMFFGCANMESANLCGFDMNQTASASNMFSGCTALDTIYTPLNLSNSVLLPTNTDTDIWYRSDGIVVTELPKNLTYNIALGKNHTPDRIPKGITECTGGTINGKGKSYGRVSIVDIGEFVKNKQVRWKFDSYSSEYQLGKTDENGYFMLESPTLTYDTEGDNEYIFKTNVAYFTGKKWITVPEEYTMEVKVEPLTVSQKWQLKTKGSFEMGIGAGLGVEAGPAKMKASFGEVGTAASSGGTMSISHGYDNGERKLTLLQTISKDVALKASVGPAVSGSIGAVKGKVSLIGVKGEATVGDSITYGLEIDDYNPADFGQIGEVGKFIATAQMYNTGNVMLRQILTLWGFENYDIKGAGIEGCLSAGASSFGGGVSDSSGEKIGFSVNVNSTGYDRTYSTGFTENGDDKTTKYEAEIASNVKEGILNFGLNGNKDRIEGFSLGSFSASPQNVGVSLKTDKDGKLTRAAYTNTTYTSWGVPFYSNTDTNEISFSVSNPDDLQRLCKINSLQNIVNARNVVFFPESYITNTWDDIRENADTLEFEVTNKEKSMIKVPIALGLEAIVDIGAGVEFAGSSEIACITQTGFTDGDSLYVTAEMQNTQADINNAKMDLSEFLAAPLKAAGGKIGEFLIEVTGKAVDGVQSGLAWVGEKLNDGTDWILHIISVKSDEKSRTVSGVESFEISTYMTASTENDETPGASMTVGDSYMVYVTDNTGDEVPDFTDHPLVLKLGYDDASLTAAGVTDDTLSALGIYMYLEDKCGYIYLGGEIDTINQQVTIDITKPGQYILAADSLAPSIYDIYISDTSPRPTITAFLSELSGFSQFSMKIDGVEYVNETSLDKYLDQSSGSFVYKIAQDLSAGEHTLSFTATDSRGNATKQPITFAFVVDSQTDDTQFFDVTFDLQGHGIALEEYQTYKNIPVGSKIAEPPKPQSDGYVFLGWYKDAACVELWDFSADIVDKDLILYAGWKEAGGEGGDDNPSEEEGVLPGDIPADGKIPDGLWVAAISDTIYTGNAIKPIPHVYDSNVRLKAGTDYTVTYKNNIRANDASNIQTAPTITVIGKGNYSGRDTVTFKILPIDLTESNLIVSDMTKAYNKKVQKPIPSVTVNNKRLKNKIDFALTYPDSGDEAYKSEGTYRIILKGEGNYSGERILTFEITNKILISKVSVDKIQNQVYTGEPIKPYLDITYKKHLLCENEDYELEYKNNTEIGTASIIIKGKGEYSGQKIVTFKITGPSISKAKVTMFKSSATYTGEAVIQNCMLILENDGVEMILEQGKDYTVTYQNNIKKGAAKVIFTGINGYVGKIQKSYKITAYNIGTGGDIEYSTNIKAVYAKGGSKPEPEISFKGDTLIKGVDYTLSYRNNKVIGDSKPPTIIVTGKGNFNGKLEIPFTIEAQELSNMTLVPCDKVYKPKANIYRIAPKLKDLDGKLLTAGKDFDKNSITYVYANDVSLENGISKRAGDQVESTDVIPANTLIAVTIHSGTNGYYKGTFIGTYRIVKSSISSAKVTIPAQIYTGKEITLDKSQIKIMIGQTMLREDDYDIVSYDNNIKKGKASVTIRGKNNYGGLKTVTFNIRAKGFLWWWR